MALLKLHSACINCHPGRFFFFFLIIPLLTKGFAWHIFCTVKHCSLTFSECISVCVYGTSFSSYTHLLEWSRIKERGVLDSDGSSTMGYNALLMNTAAKYRLVTVIFYDCVTSWKSMPQLRSDYSWDAVELQNSKTEVPWRPQNSHKMGVCKIIFVTCTQLHPVSYALDLSPWLILALVAS